MGLILVFVDYIFSFSTEYLVLFEDGVEGIVKDIKF